MELNKKHAKLSASTAHRWLECTPSASLEALETLEECSVYAAEGTAAHELAEIKLSYLSDKIDEATYNSAYKTFLENTSYYNKGFEEFVDEFVNFVRKNVMSERTEIYLEERVDFSDYVPEGFGTADVILVDGNRMHVIDLKFGMGVPVSAINNPQLRLYGLGALKRFPHITEIMTSIFQPRLYSFDTEENTAESLRDWGNTFVKPRAELAIKGEGVLKPSEKACKFCKLKGKCKERADQQLAIAQSEFEIANTKPPVQSLSVDEISRILEIAPAFMDWLKDVQAHALGQLMQGVEIPGYKLVEGRSVRIITDPSAVKEKLLKLGFEEKDIMKPQEMLGLTGLEGLIGKKLFASLFADYLIKPQGKLTMAVESDKRPAISTLELARNEFNQ